jgi:hypothetical protein
MAIVPTGGKKFEKPSAGIWLARVIDVVQLGLVPNKNTQFAPVVRTQIKWVLAPVPGQGLPTHDSEGRAFQHIEQPPAKMTPPTKYQASRMYKLAEQVFGGPQNIPQPFDDEYFMDRINQIVLVTSGQNAEYRSIAAMMPVAPAQLLLVPKVPDGYIRVQNRPKQSGQQNPATTPMTTTSFNPTRVQDIQDEDIPF